MRWSLDNLYSSFESSEFKNDYEDFKKEIKKIIFWAEENLTSQGDEIKKMEEYILLSNNFAKYTKIYYYSNLILSVESENQTATKILDNIENELTELEKPKVMFQSFLGKISDLEQKIKSSHLLEEHRFILQEMKEQSKYMLSEKEEMAIAKLQNTGSSSWTKLQEQLTATLLVDITIDGEPKLLPLTEVRSFASSPDSELRKKAYLAELASYEKVDKPVAASLNSIKGEVITIAKLRGYASPLEMTLINSRMDRKTLDALLEAMEEFLPQIRKYLKAKANILKHKNALPFYDISAPIGEVEMKFSYEEAKNFIIKNFTDFSKKLGDFAKKAFEEDWIDAEIRIGKRGGAFCENLHIIGESRIMANFDGSFGEILTLAHELGHAYHGDCLNNETYLNSDYCMPIAETASTFCENIISKAALKTASDEEKKVILENELQGTTQVIVDIFSRFLFEGEVFKQRENGPLSVAELKDIMIDAQISAYGDSLEEEFLHPYMWLCKPHYYSADYNYYNFPYAYGLLFAKGLYSMYLEKGEAFIPLYDELLASTGKNNLVDVAKSAGIDVTSKDFWVSSLKVIKQEVDEFLKLG